MPTWSQLLVLCPVLLLAPISAQATPLDDDRPTTETLMAELEALRLPAPEIARAAEYMNSKIAPSFRRFVNFGGRQLLTPSMMFGPGACREAFEEASVVYWAVRGVGSDDVQRLAAMTLLCVQRLVEGKVEYAPILYDHMDEDSISRMQLSRFIAEDLLPQPVGSRDTFDHDGGVWIQLGEHFKGEERSFFKLHATRWDFKNLGSIEVDYREVNNRLLITDISIRTSGTSPGGHKIGGIPERVAALDEWFDAMIRAGAFAGDCE